LKQVGKYNVIDCWVGEDCFHVIPDAYVAILSM